MAYSIRLPDGTLVRNIPDELSPEEAKARIIKAYPQYAPESSALRQAADIPVQVGRGAVMGVRMLSDALGADNPVSQALRGAEDYLGDLLSASAKKDQQEIARIMKDAEDKGVLDQVKAGIEALTVAPVDLVSQVLGTAVPTIAAGMAGAAAKLGTVGIGTLQAGTGAAMGAGLTKGNIFEVVKEELTAAGVPEQVAEERAKAAQNYTGENWDQIILGGTLGGAAALGPLERIFARVPAISPQVAAKNLFTRASVAGVAEAVPEAAQAFQEQVAQNLALQREGFDVPTFRGAVANATLEGLAGFGIGAPIGALEGKPGATKPPGQQEPTEPAAPPPPPQVVPEGELTPDEEAELQARIAAAPPPPAVAPVAPTPPIPPTPAPAAVQPVTATPEAVALPEPQQVTPQIPVEAAPELEALTAQLGQIQQARMDPTLTPDDPAFLELDQQEAAIQTRIQQLTATPEAVTQPPAQPLAPPVAPIVEPEVIPEEAVVTPEIQVPFDETLTPPGPTLEDQVRAQKAEERRERQAAQEAKKGEFVLQNRDRSSTGSIQQMQNIANAPDYSRAGFSRTPDGAPIIAFGDYAPEQLGREDVVTTARGRKIPVQYAVVEADEVITSNDIQGRADNRYGDKTVPGPRAIAGNGRVTGLREAFERGTAAPYVEEMAADSSLHGISPDVIAGMQKPVLVRVMPQEGLTRDIGDELNISSMLELSPVEQAKNDLNRVEFDALQFDEDGEITNESLSQFIAAQPVEERTKLIDRGLPTKQARQRLENAIFARAYADDDLIAMFAQTEDVEARLVINALAQVAPQMAQLEGAGDLDIRDIVTDAAKIIVSGKRRGLKLREISSQVDMTVDPDTKIIVDMFAQNPRSNKAAIESLRNAAELAYNESIRPEEGLFGVEPRRERRDIMEQMRRGYEPTRTEDVAAAERPRSAPSDVERKAEPSAARVPPADQDFVLTGQTPEELAELQRRELSGEAEAERDRLEAEEAARAAAEAERKVADQKRETFELAPPPAAPTVRAAAPSGDLFGAAGITEQPTRAPRPVAAEPSPIEQMAEDARAAEEMGSPQQVLDELVKELGRGVGKRRIETPDATTILTEETWDGDTTIKRFEFDAIVSLANKTDTSRGAKYSILIKETPTESITFAFQPMGLKPLDRRVDIKYVLSKTTLDTEVPPLEDAINERMRQLGVADFEDASNKVQEAYGVSKPVADAYVRAVRKQAEAIAKSSYGKATENEFQDAYDEAEKLRKRMEGISKRKAPKAEVREEPEASQLQYAQDALDEYVDSFRDKLPSKGQRSYDAQTNTVTDVLTAKDDVSMTRADFDALVSIAKATDTTTGRKYSIVVEDTPEKSSIFTFQPRGLKATDPRVQVFAQLEETNRYVEELTLDEQIEKSLKEDGLDDPAKASKKYQEEFGISKPVADALVRAEIERNETSWKQEYGAGTEADAKAANKKYWDLRSKAEEISKQPKAKPKAKKAAPKKEEPAAKTPTDFYQQMMPDAGFKRLAQGSDRTYKNKSGEEFLTFERDGVRVAVKSNTQLYADNRGVGMYMGEGNDLLIQAMIVDESARRQGKATKALQDILSMADQAGMTSYIEPVQMTKDVGMTTEQLKDFYKRFGFKPQKTEPVTDRVMVREPGAKIEIVPTKEKLKTTGMSITEIMAETEKVRQQLVEMGVDPDPTYRPKDTSKEEREAKEAKKRKELTRLAGESSRIEKLTKEPIIANAEQRSAAERLARSVNGELLFLDGSRGLGIVFAKDREGNDAYLPIHGGKISRVDVRDFTGLKSTDKEYLKKVRSELVRDAGARQKRKDDEADWEFMNIEFDMPNDRQRDLFGSTTEAKQIAEAMEPKAKKLPPGRSPELTTAARAVQAGAMTAAEYNALVDKYKPIPLYSEPLKPATSEQVFDALDVKKREQINPQIPNGTKVGLRLDIPAFNRKGVFVVSIHQKRTASAPGKVIGYGSVAKAKNVTFGVGNQLKALEIAAGSAKDALQTIEGEYVNVNPEQAFAEAQRAIKDPNYIQVGIDPTRHAYFYDRRTTLPVVAAEEVIQIGNMILAKKPTFGKKEDFLYSIETGPIDDGSQAEAKRDNENKETLKDLQSLRREKIALPEKVRNYGSTAEGQRVIAALNMTAQELDRNLSQQKYEGYTADNFMRQARKARDDGSMSADVFGVIQAMYMDDPKVLDGLRLDVKQKFSPEEIEQRRAEGKKIPLGAFAPLERVVNLYTGTRGLTDPTTIRHELTHTLEQMMTPAQRKAVINSYFAAIQKAAKKHKDAKSQEFFDNVIKYLNEPFPENREAMNKSLPSIDFYQFTSPSEYWAVNAEKLMAQRLGTAWDRFKKAVRKMFEKMKNLLGFDNSFVVHDVFDKIMSGSRERMTTSMLMEFIKSDGQSYEFLENIEDDAELVRRYNRADTPMLDHSPMRRMMVNAASFTKDMFKDMAQNPSEALRMMFNSVNRGVMYLRNKNIWFGSGINEADRIRYNGQLKTAEGLATASLALDNMIRGGNIATQVVFLGGIEFNKDTQMYSAVQKAKSMTKVYEAEAKLKERLGEQLGTNIIQGYLEAKRSRSIKEEVETRKEIVEAINEEVEAQVAELKALDADPKATKEQKDAVNRELRKLFKEYRQAREELNTITKIAEEKVTMSEAEIEDFISREDAHPELKEILDNFGAVNQNLLRFWKDVGLLSDPRYERLAAIKDYVPWYRIMNDEEDVHSPLQATTRSATNIGKEKLFKSGKPSVINDFIIEEGQDVFKIQPSRINAVKLNGIRLKPDQYESTPNGEVRLKVEYKPNDVLVIETQREIENMIDNMTRNVMRMTMNGLRKYAANRIVSEYATRDAKGQIMTFPKVDREKGRFDFIVDGRRTVVEIQDPLIAEAALGMETVGMEMWKPLAAAANFTRRTITLSPVFQLKQVFKDAPTAALVTGVKNPAALMGGVMRDFVGAIRDNDPVATILRNQGIGGFYSPARTPEADVKRRIGIINNNTFDYTMKALDHFGDSSDMAQRIAIYKRVMAETGDESLALYQAANVINFLRHGSGQVAQALVKTVPFLNAYAQSIDVLFNALVGGGLRGKDRAAALKQLAVTGGLLAGTTLLYAMLVGDDDDYMKMDDQSKIRSYMIPGTDVVLPMNTSAAFFFKAIPELIYNKVVNEGTENEVDAKRLRTAMKEAAVDLLLGPTPVPSAVKPVIEISLDYNFFTSRPITPRGMENLDAYQQYDMRTSDAARLLSALTGTKENRVLNPMEADHLIRSIFGTAGAMVAWSSNLIGASSEYRPEMGLKDMPITGAFLRPEIPRGREDLFYKLKENTDRKYRTFNRLIERDQMAEAEAYLNRHPNLIAYYDYTSDMDTQLKEINAAIRFIGETQDPSYTPKAKRREIQELLNLKQDILEGIEQFRKEAYAD